MHSSIAKAQVKGTFRVANDVLDKYNAEAEKRVGQNKPFSRKSMTAYVQNLFDMYGDLLLFQSIISKTVAGTSTHLILQLTLTPLTLAS